MCHVMCVSERYNRETLEYPMKGKNISQVLYMTVEDAHTFFEAVPSLARKLHTLMAVGLSYITLGKPRLRCQVVRHNG